MGKREHLADLRETLAKAEREAFSLSRRGAAFSASAGSFSLGDPALDGWFGGAGLPRGTVHAVSPERHGDGPAATGFVFRMLCSFLSDVANKGQAAGPVLWCYTIDSGREFGIPYGPGLCQTGLDPEALIFVEGRHEGDVLWAAEEGLKVGDLSAVVAVSSGHEPFDLLTLTRRLQLAAQASGVTVFFIRLKAEGLAGAARTHWRVSARPGSAPGWAGAFGSRSSALGLGPVRYGLQLVRYRGGAPGAWDVEWNNETLRFCVVPALADRPVFPAAGAIGDTGIGTVLSRPAA